MHKVWLLLLPRFPLVDVSGMLAVFEAANAQRRNGTGIADYGVRLVCAAGGPVLSSSGVALSAGALPRQLAGSANTLVIAGQPGAASAAKEPASVQHLREWLSSSRRHLNRCAMLGTKALPLVPELRSVRRRKSPAPPALLHVRQERSAPFTARVAMRGWRIIEPGQGVDLALSWVEQDQGTGFADTIASRLPEPRSRRYGMKRYRSVLIEQPSHDARIAELHQWIATHLREKLSVARLAQEVHMSARSFARFYRRETGLTPGRGVQQIRLDMACRLIKTSTRPLKAIAAQCGYRSREVMRRVFLRSLQMTPCEYRRRHAMASSTRPT